MLKMQWEMIENKLRLPLVQLESQLSKLAKYDIKRIKYQMLNYILEQKSPALARLFMGQSL